MKIKCWYRRNGGYIVGFKLCDLNDVSFLETTYRFKDFPTDLVETWLEEGERIVGFRCRVDDN